MSQNFGVAIWIGEEPTAEMIIATLTACGALPLSDTSGDDVYWEFASTRQRILTSIVRIRFLPPCVESMIRHRMGGVFGLILGFDPPFDWPLAIAREFLQRGGVVTVREDEGEPGVYDLGSIDLLAADSAWNRE